MPDLDPLNQELFDRGREAMDDMSPGQLIGLQSEIMNSAAFNDLSAQGSAATRELFAECVGRLAQANGDRLPRVGARGMHGVFADITNEAWAESSVEMAKAMLKVAKENGETEAAEVIQHQITMSRQKNEDAELAEKVVTSQTQTWLAEERERQADRKTQLDQLAALQNQAIKSGDFAAAESVMTSFNQAISEHAAQDHARDKQRQAEQLSQHAEVVRQSDAEQQAKVAATAPGKVTPGETPDTV